MESRRAFSLSSMLTWNVFSVVNDVFLLPSNVAFVEVVVVVVVVLANSLNNPVLFNGDEFLKRLSLFLDGDWSRSRCSDFSGVGLSTFSSSSTSLKLVGGSSDVGDRFDGECSRILVSNIQTLFPVTYTQSKDINVKCSISQLSLSYWLSWRSTQVEQF